MKVGKQETKKDQFPTYFSTNLVNQWPCEYWHIKAVQKIERLMTVELLISSLYILESISDLEFKLYIWNYLVTDQSVTFVF